MTLLGGAVYAGFFALAALWLAATNPDTADERAQADSTDNGLADSVGTAAELVEASPCCAGQSSLN